MKVDEAVLKMVWFTPATNHDHVLLGKLKPDSNTIYCVTKATTITSISEVTITRLGS
jgi:hypothetical protein